jgi:hypothetical protein
VSLTLPSAYSSASKLSNIQENWIIQLGFFNGDAQGRGEGAWDAVLQMGGAANLLNEAVSEGETLVDVDDSSVFKSGDYIKVDNEIMKVLTAAANTLGLKRGQMGTTDTTHTNNTAIYWNNFTPIALSDTTVDDVFYHGVITNTPSVRSSINLAKSTAKTGNISLSVANFQFKGDDFSAELFLGTRKYINRNVKIYSQLNGDSTLSNCLQIYQGRLIDVSHDDDTIKLTITEQRPWDFITFPQDTATMTNQYVPISYGDFSSNSPTSLTLTKDMYPMPFLLGANGYRFISTNTVSGGSKPHYYDKNGDIFMQLTEASTSSDSFSGVDTFVVDSILKRKAIFRPSEVSGSGWDSNGNAIDTDVDSYAESSVSLEAGGPLGKEDTITLNFEIPQIAGKLNIVKIYTKWRWHIISSTDGSGADVYPRVTWVTSFAGTDAGQAQATGTVADVYMYSSGSMSSFDGGNDGWDGNYDVIDMLSAFEGNDNSLPSSFSMTFKVQTDYITDDIEADIRMYDVYLEVEAQNDPDNEPNAASEAMEKLGYIYSGNDGLTNSFVGGSGAADTGLEVHRDLLVRFSGFDDSDGDIYNYDANLDIEASRITSAWNIRWWALEPVELKKILEQLQYEFCFIFKWKNGLGSYWFVKDSYSSGDVAQTLKKDDITNLKINNTPFSELLTNMEIKYEKHPVENRCVSSVTAVDSTNKPRRKWNIQSKENIKEIKLDMNVNKPGNANPGGGDPNDGFADYYMNIFGDIKKIISCDIVNSAVSYNLETGDIIQFSNTAGEMHVEPFGDDWQDYYMITNLNRSPGKVGITAREVG